MAAEATFDAIKDSRSYDEINAYPEAFKNVGYIRTLQGTQLQALDE
jgi:hypothetical protein